jgi:dTDP-4-dehydrorhamnose 3,5-epimerase
MFKIGSIQGLQAKRLSKYNDQRGWLIELFRQDELEDKYFPVMSYISMTNPGIARGPHEHEDQADLFGFIGPSTFKIYLWDNRNNSPTYMNKMILIAGQNEPMSILIPPGVVHAYKNIGDVLGMVVNFPNQLFMGKNRKEKVDEIRHENDPTTIYKLD